MKKLILLLLLVSNLVYAQNHALYLYKGKFALCAASSAVSTGNLIKVQGKTFVEGCAVCPVLNGPSIGNSFLVPNPSVSPDGTDSTVWSFFWYSDSLPQAPTWKTLPTVNRSFVVSDTLGGGMSNMFCMPCKVWKEVNGVTLVKCYGPLNEAAIPLRKALRVHKGQTSITQAPVGAPYPVGTIIPVKN